MMLVACSGDSDDSSQSPLLLFGNRDSGQIAAFNDQGEAVSEATFTEPAVPAIDGYGTRTIVLVQGDDWEFHLVDATTGDSQELLRALPGSQALQPSPESKWALTFDFRGDTEWTLVNLETGNLFQPSDQDPAIPPRFSSDESTFAYVALNGQPTVVDSESLSERPAIELKSQLSLPLQLSPDGSKFAHFERNNESGDITTSIVTIDDGATNELPVGSILLGWIDESALLTSDGFSSESGNLLSIVDVPTGDQRGLGMYTVNQRAAIGADAIINDGDDTTLQVLDLRSGDIATLPLPFEASVTGFPADSRRYVWGAVGGAIGSSELMGAFVYDRETGSLTTFERDLADREFFIGDDMRFSPDHRSAILSSNDGLFLATADGELAQIVDGLAIGAICADGSIAVIYADDKPAELLAAETFEPIATFPPADGWVACLPG